MGSAHKTPTTDPYAHLTEEQLAGLNDELLRAEKSYSEKFREAGLIEDPVERHVQLGNLKNSFGTRQSIIRKKWGVKLRERRTKAEIEAEKERMGLLFSSATRARPPYNRRATPPTSQNGDSSKRARTDDGNPFGTGSRGTAFDSAEARRKTPTPSHALHETPRAQPLPRPANDDDNMSDSSSDNDDIPARLPDSVRQSLSASQR